MSATISASRNTCPVRGSCSCRLTPRSVTAAPLTSSRPRRTSDVRSPQLVRITSSVSPSEARRSVRSNVYRAGASALQGLATAAGSVSDPCTLAATRPPTRRRGAATVMLA
eukprot:scaffold26314_cov63-Phaeocystis_antarctica.AAC.8